MKTENRVRNCGDQFKFICPKKWDQLQATGEEGVRHCGACNQDVFYCRTDEETIRHAKAGHCIARETPDLLDSVMVGMPADPVPEREERCRREAGIDVAIRHVRESTWECPGCGFPVADWADSCAVCEKVVGRKPVRGLEDRFVGSLLGLALGDALGAPHEGGPLAKVAWRLVGYGRGGLRWSDDTEMTLGLAESLVEHRGLEADKLARTWATRADWRRGYGPGTRKLLGRIRGGEDWRVASRAIFPEGSFGNGAAMRASPLGLFYHRDLAELVRATELASSITHAHPLGIEGGLLIARATALALAGALDLADLRKGCRQEEFRSRLERAAGDLSPAEVKRDLGTGVEAHRSAVTALYVVDRFRDFQPMMEFIVSLGGDVDTIAAMAGGIFGAWHGVAALPSQALDLLEARDRIERAARRLYAVAAERGFK